MFGLRYRRCRRGLGDVTGFVADRDEESMHGTISGQTSLRYSGRSVENPGYGALGQLFVRHSQNVPEHAGLVGAELGRAPLGAARGPGQLVRRSFDGAGCPLGVQHPAEEALTLIESGLLYRIKVAV